MKIPVAIVLILTLIIAASSASEIARITLADLEKKAEIIVLAQVTNVVRDGDLDEVTIEVDSYLKGKNPRTSYTITLVSRGGLKDFDPALKKGQSGVFFLKPKKQEGKVEKAYWGGVATFPRDHFDLSKE